MNFSLKNIPDNILVETILPRMPINNLLRLCQTNKHIYALCSSPELWQEKIIYDYKSYYNKKPENMTWQDYYIYLSIERQIPIFYHGDIIDYLKFTIPTFMEVFLSQLKQILMKTNNKLVFFRETLYFVLLNQYFKPIYIGVRDEESKALNNIPTPYTGIPSRLYIFYIGNPAKSEMLSLDFVMKHLKDVILSEASSNPIYLYNGNLCYKHICYGPFDELDRLQIIFILWHLDIPSPFNNIPTNQPMPDNIYINSWLSFYNTYSFSKKFIYEIMMNRLVKIGNIIPYIIN